MFSKIQSGFANYGSHCKNGMQDFGENVGKLKNNIGETLTRGAQKTFHNIVWGASVLGGCKLLSRISPFNAITPSIGNPLAMIACMALVNPVLNFFKGSNAPLKNSPIKNLYDRLTQTERKALDPEYIGGRDKNYGGDFKAALDLLKSARNFKMENSVRASQIIEKPVSQRRLQGRLAAGMQKDANGAYFSIVRLEEKNGSLNNHLYAVYQSPLKNSHARNPQNINLNDVMIIVKNLSAVHQENKPVIPKINDGDYIPKYFSDAAEQAFHNQTVQIRNVNLIKNPKEINRLQTKQRAKDQELAQQQKQLNAKVKILEKKQTESGETLSVAGEELNDQTVINPLQEALKAGSASIKKLVQQASEAFTPQDLDRAEREYKKINRTATEQTTRIQKVRENPEEFVSQPAKALDALERAWHGTEKKPELPVSVGAKKLSPPALPKQPRTQSDLNKLLSSWLGKATANG